MPCRVSYLPCSSRMTTSFEHRRGSHDCDHKLPIATGRRAGVVRASRPCTFESYFYLSLDFISMPWLVGDERRLVF